MKRFWQRFRIMLMTFAFGLSSVYLFYGSLNVSDEIKVELPQVQSETVIFVTPKKRVCMPQTGGSHFTFPSEEFLKEWKANCLKKK